MLRTFSVSQCVDADLPWMTTWRYLGRIVLSCAVMILVTVPLFAADGIAANAATPQELLDQFERRIAREPQYESSPRYALLVLGTHAESPVWMIEDGETLYVDRNGNGDLTDDGPPIRPSDVRIFGRLPNGKPKRDFDYLLGEIKLKTKSREARHTDFSLARWNYGDDKDGYGLRVTIDGKIPMYAGWTEFWGKSADTAPVIHLGGPLRLRMLRYKEFVLGSGPARLSIAFVNPGRGEGAHSRLSIDALVEDVVPVAEITWPVAEGAAPLTTAHRLTERCCYWEFYTREFTVPKGAVAGTAILKVSAPEGKLPLELASDRLEIPVRMGEGAR